MPASVTNGGTIVPIQGWLEAKIHPYYSTHDTHHLCIHWILRQVKSSAACHLKYPVSDSERPSQCDTRSVSGYFPASSSCQKLWGLWLDITVTEAFIISEPLQTTCDLQLTFTSLPHSVTFFEFIKNFLGITVWTAQRGERTQSVIWQGRNSWKDCDFSLLRQGVCVCAVERVICSSLPVIENGWRLRTERTHTPTGNGFIWAMCSGIETPFPQLQWCVCGGGGITTILEAFLDWCRLLPEKCAHTTYLGPNCALQKN